MRSLKRNSYKTMSRNAHAFFNFRPALLMLAFAPMVFFLSFCSTPEPGELIKGNWNVMDGMYVLNDTSLKLDDNQQSEGIEDMKKNNSFTFLADGAYIVKNRMGEGKGTWKLSEDKKAMIVTLDKAPGTKTIRILSLRRDYMKISYPDRFGVYTLELGR